MSELNRNFQEKYKQGFLEEAREIIQDLECALLELNGNPDDAELVSRAFRALHTIKGSGSMFGFDAVAAFTHHVETAFDKVRSGRLSPSPDLITLTLAAVDQIKAMLEESAGGKAADAGAAAAILAQLHELTGIGTESTVRSGSAPNEADRSQSSKGDVSGRWHIRFAPGPDLLRSGSDPLLLLRDLRQLGDLDVRVDTKQVPAMESLDPERCYLSWDMILATALPVNEIRDVFVFVEDSCELVIEPAPEPNTRTTVGVATAPAEVRKYSNERLPDRNTQQSSIRVPAGKLDQLVDLVGQLVTVQARLAEIAARSDDREIQAVSEDVEALTGKLRESSMSMRTLPMRATFDRFKRLVFDLSRNLQKDVELTVEGAETELDKTVIDQLNDPLMHLIRNSMDHGIETAAVRRDRGKPATARIHLSARHAGAQVLISVADDGKGIDPEVVRSRAIERGLITADRRLTEPEIYSLILLPGFSTATEVTDLSGRGVGMDVVRRNVEALRGTIEIASQPGIGTTVSLRLPLTLAIIDGLLVRVGNSRFIMPLANTVECVELTRDVVEEAHGRHLAEIRDEIVPYIRLSDYLQVRRPNPDREQLMVAETEHGRFGFGVDEVLGNYQTVIKSVGRLYRDVQYVSGATILGDGTVALILDLHRLAQNAIHENEQFKTAPSSASRAATVQ